MPGIDFNNSFGYNIKNYQAMQKMKFGTCVRGANHMNSNNQLYSMDSSLFKLDNSIASKNIFATNQTQSFNFGGIEYDNAYAMLNSVNNDNAKSTFGDKLVDFARNAGEKIETTAKKVGEFCKKSFDSVKSFVGKLFAKSNKVKPEEAGKVLNDIQNAQDKETLNKALDGAKKEQVANVKAEAVADKAAKAADKEAKSAEKKAESAEQQLDKDKTQLDTDKSALEQAKGNVKTAEADYSNAQKNTASAEEKLQAAKSAATPENPNTIAIQQAEAELQTAKNAEEAAKQKLDEAKQKESEAQKAVDKSNEQVKNSETETKAAKEGVKTAKDNATSAQQEVKTVQQSGKELDAGIEAGTQKLENMEQSSTNPNTAGMQPSLDPSQTSAAQNQSLGLPTSDNPTIDFQNQNLNTEMEMYGLTDEQKKEVLANYQKVENLKPGQSVQIEGQIYAMDKDGKVTIDGEDSVSVDGQNDVLGYAGTAAGNTIRRMHPRI